MTSPEGPFYSTHDADSEGEEGKFYVWTRGEVEAVLGKDEAELFSSVYDVEPDGNWEGAQHPAPTPRRLDEQDARLLDMTAR